MTKECYSCFCSGKIEQALQRQPGVLEAKVSLLTRKAEVRSTQGHALLFV
jgi:cation transport ATPase